LIRLQYIDGAIKVSYVIKTGKPVDRIVNESERDYDIVVVMASSRITSRVRMLVGNA
jgi:nucleotide-binding universal stress UspA family protein